jgi:hypothetical protein
MASVWLNHRWYPQCNLPVLIAWCSVVVALAFLLNCASFRILPLRFDLVPQDGVIRLDL